MICMWRCNRKNHMRLFECQSRPKKPEVARTNLNSSIAWKLHVVVCVEVGKITIFVPYLLPIGYVFVSIKNKWNQLHFVVFSLKHLTIFLKPELLFQNSSCSNQFVMLGEKPMCHIFYMHFQLHKNQGESWLFRIFCPENLGLIFSKISFYLEICVRNWGPVSMGT